jgi:hypothetical protein
MGRERRISEVMVQDLRLFAASQKIRARLGVTTARSRPPNSRIQICSSGPSRPLEGSSFVVCSLVLIIRGFWSAAASGRFGHFLLGAAATMGLKNLLL